MKVFIYYKEIFTQKDPYIADASRLDFFNALSGIDTNLQDDYLGIDASTPWYENLRRVILDNAAQDKIDYDTLPIDWLCLN